MEQPEKELRFHNKERFVLICAKELSLAHIFLLYLQKKEFMESLKDIYYLIQSERSTKPKLRKKETVTDEVVWWIHLLAYNTVGVFGEDNVTVVSEFVKDMDEGMVAEKYRKKDHIIGLPQRYEEKDSLKERNVCLKLTV